MKKISIYFFAFIIFSLNAISQTPTPTAPKDTTWKTGGFGSLLFNQAAFSHWAAGGENSLSLSIIATGFANYKKEKNIWENYAIINYGFVSQQYQDKVRKNTDHLELQSKYGHELAKKFYYTFLVNFQTQFAPGYNPTYDTVTSKFMAPGYLLASVGIEWKPVSYLSLYLSPATGKFTFVSDQAIADIVQRPSFASLYGTDPAVYDEGGNLVKHGKTSRAEFGAMFMATFVKDIMKNVNLATKLTLFNAYEKNTDIAFDLYLNMKVNKWLTASFFTNIVYDNDIIIADYNSDGTPKGTSGPRTQVKEGLGVGLTYKFGSQK